jgi:hypothetical protein
MYIDHIAYKYNTYVMMYRKYIAIHSNRYDIDVPSVSIAFPNSPTDHLILIALTRALK